MRNPPPYNAPSPASAGSIETRLADQFLENYRLTNSPEDQLIIELAREADHQAELYVGLASSPESQSQVSARRSIILAKLHGLVLDRANRSNMQTEIQIASRALNTVRLVMQAQGIAGDQVQSILAAAVEQLTTRPDAKKPTGT